MHGLVRGGQALPPSLCACARPTAWEDAIVGKGIVTPWAPFPAKGAHRWKHHGPQDLLRHEAQHVLERLRLAPNELLLFGCLLVPCLDDSASVFVTSLGQLVKGHCPRDDIRGLADATARPNLVPVEDLRPQVDKDKELSVNLPARMPEPGEVPRNVRLILQAVV